MPLKNPLRSHLSIKINKQTETEEIQLAKHEKPKL